MINLIKYLPFHMQKNDIFQKVFSTTEKQLNKYKVDIEDVKKQLNIDTATWALDVYEKELGIKTDKNKTLEERRSVVKSKWRGTGKVDATMIKMVCDAWTNGDVEVDFVEGKIKIKFTSIFGVPSDMNSVYQIIEDIKPSHLALLYVYRYLTHRELSKHTHEFLSSYTHEQIRNNKLQESEV